MKKVLVLGDASSVHTQRWVEGLCLSGDLEVHLLSMNPQPIPHDRYPIQNFAGAVQIAPTSITAKGGNFQYLAKLPQLRAHIRKIAPDLISTLYLTSYGFVGALLKGRAKLMHFCLGTDIMVTPYRDFFRRTLTQFALKRADFVVSASQTMTDKLIQDFRVPAEQMLTQMYGITDRVLNYARPAEQYEFVSNRQWVKNSNLEYVLNILAAVGLKSVVIGDVTSGSEDLGERLIQRIASLKGAVRFPFLPYTENIATVARSRFLISLTSSDGSSLSVMESMALGTIPLVSDIAPNREWVEHGVTGFLIPLNNLNEAVQRFRAALALSEPELAKMRTRAKAVIEDRGSLTKNMRRVTDRMHVMMGKL